MDSWLQFIRTSPVLEEGADCVCSIDHYLFLGRGSTLICFPADGSYSDGEHFRISCAEIPAGCKITALVPNRLNTHLAVACTLKNGSFRAVVVSMDFLAKNSDVCLKNKATIQASGQLVSQGAKIVQLEWHPLSHKSTSLAVLDVLSVFRLFEVSPGGVKKQLEWDLARPDLKYNAAFVQDRVSCPGTLAKDEKVIKFAFLTSKPAYATGWNAFTMITLSLSGLVRSICPVIPSNCLVNKPGFQSELFLALKQISTAVKCREHSVNVQLISHILSSSVSHPDEIIEVQPFDSKTASPFLSPPLRAAPYPFRPSVPPPFAATLGVYLTPRAPILLVGHRDVLLVYALTSLPGPLWSTTEGTKPSLTTLELVQLRGVRRLVQDRLRPHIFYCFHSDGVSALDLQSHADALNSQLPPMHLPPPASIQKIEFGKLAIDIVPIRCVTIRSAFLFHSAEGTLIPVPGYWFGKREPETTDKPKIFTWFRDYSPKYLPPDTPSLEAISRSLNLLDQEVVALNASSDYLQTRQLAQKDLIVKATEAIAAAPHTNPDTQPSVGANPRFDMSSISARLSTAQDRFNAISKKIQSLDSQLRQNIPTKN